MTVLREDIARALYEHWIKEDLANEYCCWDLLLGKEQWLDRADAVLAVLPPNLQPSPPHP